MSMPRTVCIIDDDLVSQFATRYCIEQYEEDFTILTFGSAEEGLVYCAERIDEKEDLPDIIFLDLVMGDMDGWAFLENLQLISENVKQPEVFVLSAFTNSKDRAVAKSHKLISGYFDKPLNKTNLLKVFEKKMTK